MNKLSQESSPYLRQHASNPVWWYPWGTEALEKAQNENKLLIVSIGYAACHWCHVMEHESFSDTEVAALMNSNFVNIKVDREERPDLDQIYMEALQMMTGRGGWPLNCICMPDGRPVYAGSYFTKAQWVDVLGQLLKINQENNAALLRQAEAISKGLQVDQIRVKQETRAVLDEKFLGRMTRQWLPKLDFVFGGHQGAPKFALPTAWHFLLAYHSTNKSKQLAKIIELTLRKMYQGGLYDQLQGGFARYCVDEAWEVPHFEKMLYDNAQLLELYGQAYRQFKKPEYLECMETTLHFLLAEMKLKEGGFMASIDADSEGEEGKYYIWSYKEAKNMLGSDIALFATAYDLHPRGNWEHKSNILHRIQSDEALAQEFDMDIHEVRERLRTCKVRLMEVRRQRPAPSKDDKVICAWNGMLLSALVEAYSSSNNKQWLDEALQLANFISDSFCDERGGLYRLSTGGKHKQNAFLDDYAFTIKGYLSLYECSFDNKWLEKADDLCKYVIDHFSGNSDAYFYYSSDLDHKLIARKREMSDNVMPSSNSQMAINLYKLSLLLHKEEWHDRAKAMLLPMVDNIEQGGAYFSNWALLYLYMSKGITEICIIGENWQQQLQELRSYYRPGLIFTGGADDSGLPLHKGRFQKGQTLIYICKDKMCAPPLASTEEVIKELAMLNEE